MIQIKLKLRLNNTQQRKLDGWLINLSSVYNWSSRKIGQDSKANIRFDKKKNKWVNGYYNKFDFTELLAGHGKKIGIPNHTIREMALIALNAWIRYFKQLSGRPKLKGTRNRLNSIPFPDWVKRPVGNRVSLPGIGSLKFFPQDIPAGKIKCARVVKRASNWYLYLTIDAPTKEISRVASNQVGIDPGFRHLLTLSTGEKIEHPREFEKYSGRIQQSRRGRNKKLTSKLELKIANKRKDRNHKLSRKLVSENSFIAFSKDQHAQIARKFGKSVSSSGHGQLQRMLEYKSRLGGTRYVEVNPKNSTRTCSTCKSLTGPTGWNGLAVRQWRCSVCGTDHDRDINAAVNTLLAGLGDEPRVDRGISLGPVCLKTPLPIKTAEELNPNGMLYGLEVS